MQPLFCPPRAKRVAAVKTDRTCPLLHVDGAARRLLGDLKG